MKPLKRFYNLLELDKKMFTNCFLRNPLRSNQFIAPLGIQAITNFIQSGRASASWIVLIVLVVLV
jgi:hypothetical protein